MKEKVTRRIYSNVSARDYEKLNNICRLFGFKSVYQLIQVLLRCFLRYASHENDPQPEPEYSMGKEIEDMFEDMMEPIERQKYYTTFRGRRPYEKH